MKFDRLYRASLYVALFLSTLLLSVDAARDNQLALFYPLAVAIASFLAFATVDRDPKRGLPRDLANFLALLSFGLGLLEYFNDENLLMLSIGHTLIYLQIIKYFLPKTVEDDWYLFLLGLVQVVIGVHTSQSDEVGLLLFVWAIATLWTFGLFYLRRESARPTGSEGVTVTPLPDRDEPYPGLLDRGFLLATIRAAATTMALGALIFLLMPRWTVRNGNRSGQVPAAKHLTGFSDSVTLGNMGEILENDTIVLSIELTDEDDRVVTPPADMLLRGVTLTDYSDGTWSREAIVPGETQSMRRRVPRETAQILQRIKMEPTDSDVLFALRPILQVEAPIASEVRMNAADGTIFRGDLRPEAGDAASARSSKFDYLVRSAADGSAPQPGETFVNRESLKPLLALRGDLEDSLGQIVEPILAELAPEKRSSNVEKARALERHLRDGTFTYSLKMTRADEKIDPVLDFLINRKEGHCEYFASALTLMCRAAGIPSRMVNGFKGGDWNDLARVTHVREKHAHSWVEALVGRSPRGAPLWITLDPTPGRQREEVVARVGSGSVRFRYLSDYVRYQWTFNVVGFDKDRQQRKIYGPIRQLAEEAARGFRILFAMIRDLPSWLYFEDFRHFFSVRGFFVSVLAMLALLGLSYAARWLWQRVFRRLGDREREAEGRDPTLAFYHRLLKILAAIGLERPPAETPREFARRAADAVAGRRPGDELAGVPALVVDAFYSKRFGRNELPAETLRDLDGRLEALETALAGEPRP